MGQRSQSAIGDRPLKQGAVLITELLGLLYE
jgi:hypothetical protein